MSTPTLDPVRLCAAMADDSRWQILQRLGTRARSASELATELPISRQAIVRHLRVLAEAGLAEAHRDGRQLRYVALGARLSELAGHLDAIGRTWDARLARLAAQAEARAGEDPSA